MRDYAYRLLNVFAEATFGGNPLCVFEDGRGLSDAEMQALARQFNLSETVFLLPSDQADRHMRIFTPGTEMAFAGHPSVGSAAVVSELLRTGSQLSLSCRAGIVPLQRNEAVWSFVAPKAAQVTPCSLSVTELAPILGLQPEDIVAEPLWVNTGSDQLLIAVHSATALQQAGFRAELLAHWPRSSLGRRTVFVFYIDQKLGGRVQAQDVTQTVIQARYFFKCADGGIGEDPATGSACANLGAWLRHQKIMSQQQFRIEQGVQMGRPSVLYLDISGQEKIQVGGKVIEIGRGRIQI
ncbi:PhzF family phenazine biosynthesis protein [Undibacterium sp. BYS50W]|nr:PhzF family phenazine biosynthesis protein [Undibacterium rugosum]MBR7778145.1 PhzF family phenazine biosynthesis protein [Undibacterium rugosum]